MDSYAPRYVTMCQLFRSLSELWIHSLDFLTNYHGQKRRECTFGHSQSTEAPSTWQAHHSPLKPIELGPAPWKPAVQLQYEEPCVLLEVSLLLLLFPSWQADDAGAVLLSWQLTPVTWFDLMLRFKTKLRSTAGHVREVRLVWFTCRVVWGPQTPCSSGSTVALFWCVPSGRFSGFRTFGWFISNSPPPCWQNNNTSTNVPKLFSGLMHANVLSSWPSSEHQVQLTSCYLFKGIDKQKVIW